MTPRTLETDVASFMVPVLLCLQNHGRQRIHVQHPRQFHPLHHRGYVKYTKEHGAVASRTEQADSKSGLLYKAIDDFDGFYACPVDKGAAPVSTAH